MTERGRVLDVRSAARRFGACRALAGVDLSVEPGEWVGLLGPNGAGKTTLMRAIAGLLALDTGEVRVLGAAVTRGRPSPRLGLVPQEIALYPLLSARENLEVFARLHGVSRAEVRDRVRWALDWTGLDERADDPVERYSGGMRRRLNIACAVLHRPAVVLLDEPTVGVDPQARYRIHDMLDGLRSDGAAIVHSSHQLDEAQARCDRLLVLDRGRIVGDGTLGELAGPLATRAVRVVIDAPLDAAATPAGLVARGVGLHGSLDDVAVELPAVLAAIRAAGRTIEEVHVGPPSLDEVFAGLTGRDLRE